MSKVTRCGANVGKCEFSSSAQVKSSDAYGELARVTEQRPLQAFPHTGGVF